MPVSHPMACEECLRLRARCHHHLTPIGVKLELATLTYSFFEVSLMRGSPGSPLSGKSENRHQGMENRLLMLHHRRCQRLQIGSMTCKDHYRKWRGRFAALLLRSSAK